MSDQASNSGLESTALSPDERDLGLDRDITRRDFVNAMAAGSGAALLGAGAPLASRLTAAPPPPWHPWTGYGGVGDYARSNGNTWDVVNAGHGLRDSLYEKRIASAKSTGETYDLVIVGGGFSGTVAAYQFLKETDRKRGCLILDNHPVIGGEAKRNEFVVRGQRLLGPQGSNGMIAYRDGAFGQLWRDVGLPYDFEFGQLPPSRKPMEFPLDNYMYQFWADDFENHGYFFDQPKPHWVTNPFGHDLQGVPWPEAMRRDLLRWRNEPAEAPADALSHRKWLDTMTYDDYLTKERKLHPDVGRFLDPILAAAIGLGTDALSAVVGHDIFFRLPGGHKLDALRTGSLKIFSFPGGNDGLMRAIVKWLHPDAIEGSTSFADLHNGRIRFDAMDRPGAPCRMRTGATVVRLKHDPGRAGEPITLTYVQGETLHSVKARTVIWAGAAWTAKHAITPLPEDYRTAMESFPRSPMLVVNVALDNWRALYRLGYSACSWRGGFGFSGNLRAPMYVGDYRPPLDPDQPTVFTFYVPFNQRGLSLVDQGKMGRQRLFATSYREYEIQIRRQMVTLFQSAGFDAARDIAGIVLNRWGHAYVTAGPGFFFGRDGKPAPSDVLRRPLGRVTFAHSELSGHQSSPYSVAEGIRAAKQVVAML